MSASSFDTINFQGKIAIKADGSNITSNAPACILEGADTCDFRISYFSVATEGTSLYTEVFTDVELGDYQGIFNLALGSGTDVGGSETTFANVFINNSSVFLNIEFDATGSGNFATPEVFTVDGTNRMPLRAVPFAITAANLDATNNQFIKNQSTVQTDASFNISGSGAIAGNFTVDGVDSTFYVDSEENNVGIGTTSPKQKLHVVGDVRIDGILELSPTQINQVLQARDANNDDHLGSSVSLSADGSVLAVGARLWEGASGSDRGGVYIYDWSGSAWVQRGNVLEAGDAADSDFFGSSTSLSADGNILVVGAYMWEGASGSNRGGVYIYDWNGSAWVQRGTVLEASDAADLDLFGISTSISADGDILAVGAFAWEGASGSDRGGVYIYDWSGSAWVQRGSVLEANDATDSDSFGSSTSLSADGNVLVVGAYMWEGASGSNRGGIYIYDWNGSAWVQRGNVLEAGDATDSDLFGISASISANGDVLVVGAQMWEGASGSNRGGIYIYDWSGSAWEQRGVVLEADDAADTDSFGGSVSMSADGSILVTGAGTWEGTSGSDRGGVYTYSLVANRSPFANNANGIAWNTINNNSIFVGGNVGIGSTSADSLFTVGTSSGFKIDINGAITAATGITSSGNVTFSGIASSGGGTNYALRIDSTGLVYKDTSSIRYKENVLGLTDNFAAILDINPVTYNFIGKDYTDIGFIAEELDEKGLGNLVIYDELGRPDGVKYEKIPLYLLEIIKQQQSDINSLYMLSNLGDLGDELHALNYLTVDNLTSNTIDAYSINTENISASTMTLTGLLSAKQIETELISAFIGQSLNIILGDSFGNTSLNIMNTDNTPIFTVASNGDVRILGKMIFDTEGDYASVGTAVIPMDTETIMIETLSCTIDSKVFITVVDEEGLDFPNVKVVEKGEGYFIVKLNQAQLQDIYLDWWVIN